MSELPCLRPALPLTAAAILAGTSAFAGDDGKGTGDGNEIPFEEARLYFELNDTDGDLGIHSLVDGNEWQRLEIDDPNDARMLDILVRGRLRKQGLTEVFFESAEPTFDELAPETFFERFPEGVYDFSGVTLDDEELDSEVTLSHVLAAPPENVRISGVASAEGCDADPLPSVSAPITISWDPVTQSHPEIGKQGAVEVEHYEVVIEREEPTLLVFSVELPPEVTELAIPDAFIALGDAFKLEIIVKATNGNQTAVESCFEIAG